MDTNQMTTYVGELREWPPRHGRVGSILNLNKGKMKEWVNHVLSEWTDKRITYQFGVMRSRKPIIKQSSCRHPILSGLLFILNGLDLGPRTYPITLFNFSSHFMFNYVIFNLSLVFKFYFILFYLFLRDLICPCCFS